MNPLLAQLTHKPFPEVAEAIRASVDKITVAWDAAVRKAMPQMNHLTIDELKDSTPQILVAMADALASDDPQVIHELIERAPQQGLSRLRLNFDLIEVMQEDRLLRAITVEHVDSELGRRLSVRESEALHAVIDVMLQRSVIALVEKQKTEIRAAAETQLKFLSFLSHDLNNNLGSVSMWLQILDQQLIAAGGFAEAQSSLSHAQKGIRNTVAGMRLLLEHEHLRKADMHPALSAVNLHQLVTRIASQFHRQAKERNCQVIVEVPQDTLVKSNEQLLTLVLQNLVGNAVKFSGGKPVRIGFDRETFGEESSNPSSAAASAGWCLWVSDKGPGIAKDKQGIIFEAFKRGEDHGQPGLGLGLAIASQAARILHAKLEVESTVEAGSIFFLILPPTDSKAPVIKELAKAAG